MNELALFAGAGGGILGGHLLGWRTVCAVEREPYAASVLMQRQNDGILAPFPIWDDVCTFDGTPWRGIVDVVSGGFPCQDISAAGNGAGIDGERSGLWREMARIIGEVRPRFVFVENSPLLVSRGLALVVSDLAEMGMTRNGCVYQHPTLERPISATASGLWPTPRSCSAMAATITPESSWQENRFPNLETIVERRMWPTPNATDANKWNNQSLADRKAKGQQIRLNTAVSPEGGAGGQLNPTWVEWLMGWPLGWTDLKPLEMDRFQEWQQQHSIS